MPRDESRSGRSSEGVSQTLGSPCPINLTHLLRRNPTNSMQQNQNKPTPFLESEFRVPDPLTVNLSEYERIVSDASTGNTQELERRFPAMMVKNSAHPSQVFIALPPPLLIFSQGFHKVNTAFILQGSSFWYPTE